MKTTIATLALTALTTLVAGSGCTHYANVSRVDDGSRPGQQRFESSRMDRHGNTRVAVYERVEANAEGCLSFQLRRDEYAVDGALQRRVLEQRDCDDAGMRIVDRYVEGSRTREVQHDLDNDGHYEQRDIRIDPVDPGHRGAIATTR